MAALFYLHFSYFMLKLKQVNDIPRVLEYNGFIFFFYSNEGIPLEQCHVHVRQGSSIAKFTLDPEIMLNDSWGFHPAEMKLVRGLIIENEELIRRKWNEFFSGKGQRD